MSTLPERGKRLAEILERVLSERENRPGLVKDFQQQIWNSTQPLEPASVDRLFAELAYDLDFYEPDPSLRKEDPSYFGDDRLEEGIFGALRKLKQQGLSWQSGGFGDSLRLETDKKKAST